MSEFKFPDEVVVWPNYAEEPESTISACDIEDAEELALENVKVGVYKLVRVGTVVTTKKVEVK